MLFCVHPINDKFISKCFFFWFENNIEFNLIYLLKIALCSLTATTKDEKYK